MEKKREAQLRAEGVWFEDDDDDSEEESVRDDEDDEGDLLTEDGLTGSAASEKDDK